MKKNSINIISIIMAVMFVSCLFVHRRVVRAIIKHEEMPKAPKWHSWVPKDKRRD